MLANGTKLYHRIPGSEAWIEALKLQEIPELGSEDEKVDMTHLASKNKEYEYGIGDYGDLEYKFIYENKSETSPYRVFRQAQADKEVLEFKQEYPDGLRFIFPAMCNVKLGGGGVNGGITFSLKLAIQGEMTCLHPGEEETTETESTE
ncbi:MAG: phage tail protein [Lachnospiraceae bacterium]|nr:phage tail protein [Lachnospiraceae bacterium]